MAIQLRRGAYADFDPTKMVPAEVGIVTSGDPNTDDGKAAYVAFSAGNAKRLATVEDIATDLQEATDDAVGQATARAEAAAESVEASAAQITTNKNDIADLKADLRRIGLSDAVKTALLNCFAHVAWDHSTDKTYYDALEAALQDSQTVTSITAVFAQGSNTVYDTDDLDSLKSMLTVTATYSDQTSRVVDGYTLSGTLTEGTSVITVSYGGQHATFNVNVTWGYKLAEPFVSTGSNLIETDKSYEAGAVTVALEFVINSFSSAVKFLFGTGTSGSYVSLQTQFNNNTNNYLWGMGIGWGAGKDLPVALHVMRLVAVLNTSDSIQISSQLKDITAGTAVKSFSNTYILTTDAVKIGDIGGNGTGFDGTINEFILERGAWTSEQITAFLEG